LKAGAHLIIKDFSEINIWSLNDHFPNIIPCWSLSYNNYDPPKEKLRESLSTLGSGKIAVRGSAAWVNSGPNNYPGTYILGGYNRAISEINGLTTENEDLVNFPNFLFLSFKLEGGDWLNLDDKSIKIHFYHHCLNFQESILSRRFRIEDKRGRITTVIW